MLSFLDYVAYGLVALISTTQLVPGKTTRNKPDLLSLKAALFLFFLSTDFSRSFFPIFASHFDVAHLEKSMQMALPQVVWGFSALVATPYGYKLSNRLGAPTVLTGAVLLATLATIVMGVTNSYWTMLLCRSAIAAAYGTIAIVGIIYLNNRGKASTTAILLTAIASASIAGNALGGWTTQIFDHGNTILISSLFSLASGILLILIFKPNAANDAPEIQKHGIKGLLVNKRVQLFALLNTVPFRLVLTGFVFYLLPVFLSDYKISLKIIGQLMMFYFIVNFVCIRPFSSLLEKYAIYKTYAILSSILMASGLLFFNYSNGELHLITAAIFILSTGMALNNVIQVPIIPIIFPKECLEYGKDNLNAYFRTVERIGSVIGPLAAALLLSAVGMGVAWITGVVLLLISLGLGIFFAIDQRLCTPPIQQNMDIT